MYDYLKDSPQSLRLLCHIEKRCHLFIKKQKSCLRIFIFLSKLINKTRGKMASLRPENASKINLTK
jgi:hypothetical protein